MINWMLENKEWLFSGMGVFLLSLIIQVVRVLKKRTKLKEGRKIFSGEHGRSWNCTQHTIEVFYPEPFDTVPYLIIQFPKEEDSEIIVNRDGLWHNYGRNLPKPIYSLVEQRPEGFVLKVNSLGYYKPFFRWKAEGLCLGQ